MLYVLWQHDAIQHSDSWSYRSPEILIMLFWVPGDELTFWSSLLVWQKTIFCARPCWFRCWCRVDTPGPWGNSRTGRRPQLIWAVLPRTARTTSQSRSVSQLGWELWTRRSIRSLFTTSTFSSNQTSVSTAPEACPATPRPQGLLSHEKSTPFKSNSNIPLASSFCRHHLMTWSGRPINLSKSISNIAVWKKFGVFLGLYHKQW